MESRTTSTRPSGGLRLSHDPDEPRRGTPLDGLLEPGDERAVLQVIENALHQSHQRHDLSHDATSLSRRRIRKLNAPHQPKLHALPPGTTHRLEVAQAQSRLEGVAAIVIDVSALADHGGGPVAVHATH